MQIIFVKSRCHLTSIYQKGNLKSTGGNNLAPGNSSTNVQPILITRNQHQAHAIPKKCLQNINNQTIINPANTVHKFSGNPYKMFCFKQLMRESLFLRNAIFYFTVVLSASTLQIHWKISWISSLIRYERISIKVFGTTDLKMQQNESVKFKVKGMKTSL